MAEPLPVVSVGSAVEPRANDLPGRVAVPENSTLVKREDLGELNHIPSYNLLYGDPEAVVPLDIRSIIPLAYHWVPIGGIGSNNALRCVDGFIMSHMYNITMHKPAALKQSDVRLCAIILGAARAAMTDYYSLVLQDMVPNETRQPVLAAAVPSEPNEAVSYSVLLPPNAANRDLLVNPLALTELEKAAIKVVLHCARAIVPIQGYNLITDEHHYLTDKSKESFKSFLAVEKQVWVSTEWKAFIKGKEELTKDLLWHKSGHPIMVHIKEAAATTIAVKEKLMAANLESAASRLPALEPEVRAAPTYIKLMQFVDSMWRTMGGLCDPTNLVNQIDAVYSIPMAPGDPPLANPITILRIPPVTVSTRKEAVRQLKAAMIMNAGLVAQAYGFYIAMMDNETVTGSVGSLRFAFCLKKLMSSELGSFCNGYELYKDYKATKERMNGLRIG